MAGALEQRALAAAGIVALACGLKLDEPAVIHSASNMLIHLRPSPFVARVMTGTLALHADPRKWLQREGFVAGGRSQHLRTVVHDVLVAPVPMSVRRCAQAFGLDPELVRGLGGESGASWSVGDHVLRVGGHLGEERLALSAAAEVLPVPRVIGHVDLGDCTGTLLERLPGRPAGEWALSEPGRAHVAGAACGALHALLAEIPARRRFFGRSAHPSATPRRGCCTLICTHSTCSWMTPVR
jgi:hypothetical protein